MTSWTVQTIVSGPPRVPSLAARSVVETDRAPVGVEFGELRSGLHDVPVQLVASKHIRLFATVGSAPTMTAPLVLELHTKFTEREEPEEGPTQASSATAMLVSVLAVSVLANVVAHCTVHL